MQYKFVLLVILSYKLTKQCGEVTDVRRAFSPLLVSNQQTTIQIVLQFNLLRVSKIANSFHLKCNTLHC